MMAVKLVIDHLRLINDSEYAVEQRLRLECVIRLRGVVVNLQIDHERDDACCKREGWTVTWARLVAATIARKTPRSARDVEAIIAEHEPAIILVGAAP